MSWSVVTFDCYGTLVDWESGLADAFRAEAERDGFQLRRDEIISIYHDVEPEVQAGEYRLYRDVLAETARRVAARLGWALPPERAGFLAESLPDWPVFVDTRPALERLRTRFDLAILSNVDDDLLAATMERIGVAFDWAVTAQQVRSYKPAKGHFQRAIERAGGDRRRLLHAAQSYFHDIRPALQLKLDAVWVNRKGEEVDGARPLHSVRDLQELAEWLEV
jgi:2-haloacid dehalogenase/putative hydrolase of the HAD superfamily